MFWGVNPRIYITVILTPNCIGGDIKTILKYFTKTIGYEETIFWTLNV